MGTGTLILTLWLCLMGFSTFKMDQKIEPMVKLEQQRKEVLFVEPISSWRRLNLLASPLPTEAKNSDDQVNITRTMMEIFPQYCQVYQRKVMPNSMATTPKKLNLFFLHGAAFTSDVWEQLGTLKLMAALGYQAIAIDLPKFGLSTDGIGPVSPNKFISKVNFMEELVSTIIGDYVLVAPSMSGAYAIPFALTQPKRMAGLVLVAPAASDTVPQRKLKNLQIPTLLMRGASDNNLGPKSELDLRVIPNFQSVILKDAGHAAYIDQPDLFHTYLYNFLLKLETS